MAGKTFTTVTTALSGGPAGTTSLYLVFKGGTGNLFDVDAFTVDTGAPPAGASTLNQGGGVIALRARSNGMYVCAENAGAAPLVANRAAVGARERFGLT